MHRSQGVLAPAGPALRSEPAIVAGAGGALPWARARASRWAVAGRRLRPHPRRHRAVIPGFDDFNERVRGPDGFLLPNPARERASPPSAAAPASPSPRCREPALAPGQLLMMTIRSHDQYNTTIYGLDDRYRGIRGERRVVFMNEDDIAALALAPGTIVDLNSHHRDETRAAPRFRGRRVPDPARLRRDLLPRGEPAGPASPVRARQPHPGVEVDRHRSDAQRA